MTVFTLPVPPTVNNLYINLPRRGRAKSTAYKDWIDEAGKWLMDQRPKPVRGRFDIMYVVPRNNRRDLANHEKPLTDLLVAHGITDDDRYMQRLLMFWANRDDVQVEVVPALPAAPFPHGHNGK